MEALKLPFYVSLLLILLIFTGCFFYLIRLYRNQIKTEQGRVKELAHEKFRRAQEVEQLWLRRISSEIHDNIYQNLVALRHSLGAIAQQHEKEHLDPKTLQDSLKASTRLMHSANNLLHAVNAGIDERFELLWAIKIEADHLKEQYGLVTERYTDDYRLNPAIPEKVQVLLHRFIREALHNVALHAGVDVCAIRLVNNPENLRVEIEDFGKGMDRERMYHDATGKGIHHMKQIADYLGATLQIISEPEEGTTIQLHFQR